MSVKVSVIKVRDEDKYKSVLSAVHEAMEKAEWFKFIEKGEPLAIKPNLCLDILLPGHITSPWVLEAVILTLKEKTDKLYLVESDTYTTNVELGVRRSGLLKICEKHNVQWINLSKKKYIKVKLEGSLALGKFVEVPEILTKTSIVTVPVMKTHGNSVMSGAIKNQWGCLKQYRLDYHEFIDSALVDLNRLFKPKFCILDGTVSCEGKGPKQGIPQITDLVLASSDNVALDTIATKIMGIELEKVSHIINCDKHGTGICDSEKIEIIGEDIKKICFNFKYGQKSIITYFDLLFRKSHFIKYLMYNTFLFKILLSLARLNYPIWMFFVGNKYRNKIMNSSYGEQWKNAK